MPIEKMIDGQQAVELAPDFHGESHYEFVANLLTSTGRQGVCHLARLRLTGMRRNEPYTGLL